MMTQPRCGRLLAPLLLVLLGASQSSAQELPSWLPRYDLDIRLDVQGCTATVRQRVVWTNRHQRPADQLVFNAHAHYQVPKTERGYFAKTLELLRMNPREAMDSEGQVLQMQTATLIEGRQATALEFQFEGDTNTDLVLKLPKPVAQGQSVIVQLDFQFRIPLKYGRWGQHQGVTYLSNWLPVVAVYSEDGWQPTPFIPWHQPFFNEAGVYHARVALPADQKLANSGTVTAWRDLTDGWREASISALGVRDFALLCSARYHEYLGKAGGEGKQPPITVRVLAFPEHEFYAQEMVRIAEQALTAYSRWFGPYPYHDFTIAEAYFGWNGNECGALVMIDARVFAMPHLAKDYVDYLVSHEICHQWWYNLVGTNGYCETWMDEALATHFGHKLMTEKYGKNNKLLQFPRGLEWLPNIRREDYRNYGLIGTIGRGENAPCVQEIPKFKHLANLFSMCYDKGSRIAGMIEERLGETAFLDFIRIIQQRYRYRILRVADFQRELEEYTGQPWQEFFDHWLHGPGLGDWAVEKVHLDHADGGCRATILLRYKGGYVEPTTVGISLTKDDEYSLRIPVLPQAGRLELPEQGAVVESLSECRIKVEVVLPCKPKQIAVDPDQVIVDQNPGNNFWKKHPRLRVAPVYTALEETDLTTAFDRFNLICGPYMNKPAYDDPWYTRSTLIGVKTGLFKTQEFNSGLYAAYRTDYRDIVAGAEGTLHHWPFPHSQLGFNVEQRLATFQDGRDTAFRAEVHARHVIKYGSSLYLPPMEHVEVFGTYQDNFLPDNDNPALGSRRYDSLALAGVHYHKDYMTPYWDPIAGFRLDLTYAGGSVDLAGDDRTAHQFLGQLAVVGGFPDLTNGSGSKTDCLLAWLAQGRLAGRFYFAGGLPDEVDYFALGGGTLFRGFDQAERQGSLVWVGSLEWRLPLVQQVEWDVFDHCLGIRNVHGALFYDVGDALTRGHSAESVVHAVGAGLRVDMAIFGFVERTIVRFDVAKTVNEATPLQFWIGLQHPF